MFKNVLLITLILSFLSEAHATHLVTSELTYSYREALPDGKHRYDVFLKLIRDETTQIDFDQEVSIGVYHLDKKERYLRKKLYPLYKHAYEIPCMYKYVRNVYEYIVYHGVVDLPDNQAGYVLTWDRCCRSDTENLGTNSNGTPDQPFYGFTSLITVDKNTSSETGNKFLAVCQGQDRLISMSTYDVDGDSVDVKVVAPIVGNATLSTQSIIPDPPLKLTEAKPVKFKNRYSALAPFGLNGSIVKKENNTFEISVSEPGFYATAFQINEYRNGELVASRTDDVMVFVFNCEKGDSLTTEVYNLVGLKTEDKKALLNWDGCDAQGSTYYIHKKTNNGQFQRIDSTKGWDRTYIDANVMADNDYTYFIEAAGVGDVGKTNEVTVRFYRLGMEDMKYSNDLRLYPNPAQSRLTIKSSTVLGAIRIVNVAGIEVKAIDMEEQTEVTVDINDLPAGLYLCHIYGEHGYSVGRFVKE